MIPRGAATLLMAVALPAAARAQSTARAGHEMHAASVAPDARAGLDSLAATAARLTARYADRRDAVADGYRRVGSDFPGMGEHWLHPVALLAGAVDPARPTMLTYATIDGRPRLIGLGFVVTTSGDAAPDVPGWPFAWHEHSGLLADESGAGRGPPDGRGSATHVWVLHAWTALENPDGRYAPDNWALPFARLGLDAPAGIDADAARALSLATGGDVYLRGVLADAGLLAAAGAGREATADAALASARASAAAVAARLRAAGGARPADLAALRATWTTLDAALRAALGSDVSPLLAPPHAAPHAAPP